MAQSTSSSQAAQSPSASKKAPIWWSNLIFFIGMHVLAVVGAFKLSPWWQLDKRTLVMCFSSWQLATFGITLGYHRLWSHRSYTASLPLRVVLAGMGCLGFQGSIKWWVLRHRLHHRFTDTESDPYNANEGLFHSHMGWIFRKPEYQKMALVDRKDLNSDPVVRFQHRFYLPLTLGLGLVAPTLLGWTYGDAMGGYIWGGIIARIMIWHSTFLINSLAHYLGDQAYSEDVTAKGNLLLAIFTGGEANHNYHHAFPKDYRNGPRWTDFDPTKWIIYALHHYTPFVPRVHQTPESEILKARAHVLTEKAKTVHDHERRSGEETSSFALWSSYASATSEGESGSSPDSSGESSWSDDASDLFPAESASARRRKTPLPSWSSAELVDKVQQMTLARAGHRRPLVLYLEGFAVDATHYASEHPGGSAVLWQHAIGSGKTEGEAPVVDATAAFEGGLNDHGWSAREKMRSLRIARVTR